MTCEDIDLHEEGYGERLTCREVYPEAPTAWCLTCVAKCEHCPDRDDDSPEQAQACEDCYYSALEALDAMEEER